MKSKPTKEERWPDGWYFQRPGKGWWRKFRHTLEKRDNIRDGQFICDFGVVKLSPRFVRCHQKLLHIAVGDGRLTRVHNARIAYWNFCKSIGELESVGRPPKASYHPHPRSVHII